MCSVLAGSDAIGGQGIVGADQGFSFAQLVLDDAWLDAMNYALAGFEVNEDTLGLDTLEQVGIGSNFLSELHTVAHMRTSWWANEVFPRQTFSEAQAPETALARAQARANALILENRAEDPVIPASLVQQLDEIVGEALRCRPEAGQ